MKIVLFKRFLPELKQVNMPANVSLQVRTIIDAEMSEVAAHIRQKSDKRDKILETALSMSGILLTAVSVLTAVVGIQALLGTAFLPVLIIISILRWLGTTASIKIDQWWVRKVYEQPDSGQHITYEEYNAWQVSSNTFRYEEITWIFLLVLSLAIAVPGVYFGWPW